MDRKKEIIKFFLEKNILINKDIINKLYEKEIDLSLFYNTIKDKINSNSFLILDKHIDQFLKSNKKDINWKEYDKSVVLAEKGDKKLHEKFTHAIEEKTTPSRKTEEQKKDVKIIFSYEEESKKREIQDFVSLFNKRYDSIAKILKNRTELQNLLAIKKML